MWYKDQERDLNNMPSEPNGPKKKAQRQPASNAKRRGHFLTSLDREYLREGPEPKQKTQRIYRGKRIERERRAYKVAYARVVREAMRDARGALEDLAFLARTMEPDFLYHLVTESHPLYPPGEDEVRDPAMRDMVMLTGRVQGPVEELLRLAAARIGWERWVKSDYSEGRVTKTTRSGERVVVRLVAAIEQGLNEGEAEAQATETQHEVSILTRKKGEAAQGWGGRMSGLARVR
jgi:hypothetical protein